MTVTLLDEHRRLARRALLKLLALGGASAALPARAQLTDRDQQALAEAIEELEFLTPQRAFGTVERGRPLPYTLAPDALAAAGLTRDTWRLEVVCDPDAPPRLRYRELTIANGRAARFQDLLEIASYAGVRFFKTLTCANGTHPLGTGLWEGVPLRLLLNRVGIRSHCRRVFYHGFHNNDPRQMFRSSLPLDRIYEDPPGVPPVIVAYRLNGQWISGKRGGPVRMIVPESYGFKSIKWLNRIVLSNRSTSNDTYAQYNNTTESWMKSFARFVTVPTSVSPGTRVPLTGVAQVGTAGLLGVQVWIARGEPEPTLEDPFFHSAPWRRATILGPPDAWGGGLPSEHAPSSPQHRTAHGFREGDPTPTEWPLPLSIAHWAMLTPPLERGRYTLFCRSVDTNRRAQPHPRPLQNSGRNLLHRVPLSVE